MGKITGFMDYKRKTSADIPPLERMDNFNEFPGRSSRPRLLAAWTAACRSARRV